MGQRADEVSRQPPRWGNDTYVARPGETHVVHAEGTHTVTNAHGETSQHDPHADEPEEILAELEQTRAEMSQTIDAIQDRLSPQELKEQARDVAKEVAEQVSTHVREAIADAADSLRESVRRNTVGRAEELADTASDTARGVSYTMMETMRQNPLPTALVGLGLGWLWMNRSRSSAHHDYERYGRDDPRYGYERYPARRYGSERPWSGASPQRTYHYDPTVETWREPERGRMDAVTDRVGDAAEAVQERAGRMADQASDMVGHVGERASHVMSSAGDTASDVMSGATGMASHAGETVVDAGSTVFDAIRQNPIPAALAGIGLGWLFINTQQSRHDDWSYGERHRTYPTHTPYPYNAEMRYGEQRRSGGPLSDVADRVSETAGGVADRVSETAGGVADRVTETASDAQDRVLDLTSSARNQMEHLGTRAQHQVHRAQGHLEQMVQDNPLALGAVAVAVGAAIGMALPETRQEQELLGDVRENFVDPLIERAQNVAQETADKVQRVAEEVGTTAQRKAQEQGLPVPSPSGTSQQGSFGSTPGGQREPGLSGSTPGAVSHQSSPSSSQRG